MTRTEALEKVEAACWDEHNSALTGAQIWGVCGSFATKQATSNFTYELALLIVKNSPYLQ